MFASITITDLLSLSQRYKFTQVVNHRCALFLKGEWKVLYEDAVGNYDIQNAWDQSHLRKPNRDNKQQIALDQARKLNYSKAMKVLQSPGLSPDPPELILKQLQDLHPQIQQRRQKYNPH